MDKIDIKALAQQIRDINDSESEAGKRHLDFKDPGNVAQDFFGQIAIVALHVLENRHDAGTFLHVLQNNFVDSGHIHQSTLPAGNVSILRNERYQKIVRRFFTLTAGNIFQTLVSQCAYRAITHTDGQFSRSQSVRTQITLDNHPGIRV